jgi:hypothetical protein
VINTDQNPAYGEALRQLKRDDPNLETIEHRQAKYLNNRIEADHGAIKRLCRATLGFKSMKTAYATIKGFEVMRMIRKRQCILLEPGLTGEVRFVTNSSILPPDPGGEASQTLCDRGECNTASAFPDVLPQPLAPHRFRGLRNTETVINRKA